MASAPDGWSATQSVESADLVVLGAGVAGLAAARRASARGRSVVVLEESAQVGGLAASHAVAGMRVDLGSHRLQASVDEDLLGDLRNLLGADLQSRPRNGRVQVAGRWLAFPLRAAELATRLPRRLAVRAARDAVVTTARRDRDGSYAAVLRSGLGPAVYDAVYGPYARKVWGVDGDRLDGEQARRRLAVTSAWRLATRVGRGRDGAGGSGMFWYPRRGFGQIVEALADATTGAGGRIRTGVTVASVRARPDGVRVHWDGGELHAGQVFSSLTLRDLGRIARPAPSAQAVGDAAGLTFRAIVLVYLVHDGGRWTEYDAHYLPGDQTPVSRISEPANYRDSLEDPTSRTVLCAEIPCAIGDELWTADAAELAALVQDGLRRSHLPPVRLAGVEVRRLPQVYPVYREGYAERLTGLMAWSDRLAGVTTFGRLGLFTHANTHHELRAAYDVADCLRVDTGAAIGFDQLAWQSARDRHARLPVDD
ncbi:MAG: protoporphyrinogen/coproporphyrinogen oxidase [Angustibacter sp.]